MLYQILKPKNQFWLLVAIVVAFALRVYALNTQSLWNDEGTSVALSSLSIEAIINGAARDIHPPLYYVLLHFWMPVVGQSEFAVRFLSVSAGVLTVAFVWRVAYSVFDEQVALFAAYLSAFSPFQVYYSQEARMYIWVTLFAAMSVYAMVMMLKRQVGSRQLAVGGNPESELQSSLSTIHYPPPTTNPRVARTLFWLLYIAATIAMLYTQYVGAFVVVAENLAFIIWIVMANREVAKQSPTLTLKTKGRIAPSPNASRLLAMTRRGGLWHSIGFWLIAQLVIGSFFLPWYVFAGGQLASWPPISEPFDLPTLVWRVLNVFSVGITLEPGGAVLIAIAFAIVFLIGWRRAQDANTNWAIALLILWTIVPIAIMYVVSLSRPAYNPKFLLLATPAFYLLSARGLATIYPGMFLPRLHGNWRHPFFYLNMAIAILVVAGPLVSLDNYYHNPKYARDDYRTIVRFINTHGRDGDGLLIDAPGQIDVVRYYLRATPQLYLLPRMRPPEPNLTRADVDEMLDKVKRLLAIYYATQQSDPESIVETRLAEKSFKARDEWYGNVRFAIYGIVPNPRGTRQTINIRVGDEIVLQDCQLDQHEARAGDVLTLTLTWRAEQIPAQRYKVFVHLLDANNQVIAQRDGEPFADWRPTTTWRAGETIEDNYGVFIEPGTPPGVYRVEIGMYRADNGARLRIGESDHLIVGTVQVQ